MRKALDFIILALLIAAISSAATRVYIRALFYRME